MSRIKAEEQPDPLTEEFFRQVNGYEEVKKPPLKKVFWQAVRCTKETPFNFFPIAKWLPQYSLRNDLVNDIVAGVTVAIMHIPHGLSYASLAHTDPVVGLYMAIFPVFIYMFMGTSKQISLGTFAVLCAMVGEIVNDYSGSPSVHTGTDSGTSVSPETNGTRYTAIQVATATCLLVGVWQLLLGILRLGVLMVVMSNSLISGFTTGAAVYVFSYQLKYLFGINVAAFKGPLKLFYLYKDFFSKIKTTNLVTLSISVCAIAVLATFNEFIKPIIRKKYPKNRIPVPIELFIIIVGILLSYFLELSKRFNVKTVANIPEGLPYPQVPPLEVLPSLTLPSFVVAAVAIAVNLSLSKIFAMKGGYTISDNQELIAYGVSNLFGSFFLCLPAAASLSRSSIQFSTGGRTQLTSLFSITLIIFIVLFAGPLFEPVPYCILASVVVVTLKGLLFQILDLPKVWRENYWDGIVWLGTFLAVIVLDIDIGLGVGIVLSVVTITCSSLIFQVNVLGRSPSSNLFLDTKHYKSVVFNSKILILEIVGIINFGNCNRLEKKITDEFKKFMTFSITDDEGTSLVINMNAVTRLDPTGVDTFRHLHKYLLKSNCKLYLTNCNCFIYDMLVSCNFFKNFPKEQVLATLSAAVAHLTKPT
ncbi:hypothetical protein RUM43_011660 [Polyplax serrata]|uniref:STAS domain-containing protein n=1 Tax=Polyplax serrata TaxID=468196 RepID=A0AAN8NMG0_POLSC